MSLSFGRIARSSTVDTGYNGYKAATAYTAPDTGNVFSIADWFSISTAGCNIQYGIYSDNSGTPGSLLASSSIVSASIGSAQHVAIPISLAVVGGSIYWLAVLFQTASGSADSQYCEASGTGSHVFNSNPSSTLTNPFGTATKSSSAGDMDIAAYYTLPSNSFWAVRM